jgi:hypothetical protein
MAKRKKYKRTNNDVQNITQKTKDRATRTTLETGDVLIIIQFTSSLFNS